jgi:hypothetical protein
MILNKRMNNWHARRVFFLCSLRKYASAGSGRYAMRDHLRVRSSLYLPTLKEKTYIKIHKEKDHNTYAKDKTNVILY